MGMSMLQLLSSAAASEAGIVLNEPSAALMRCVAMTGLETDLGIDLEAGAER